MELRNAKTDCKEVLKSKINMKLDHITKKIQESY